MFEVNNGKEMKLMNEVVFTDREKDETEIIELLFNRLEDKFKADFSVKLVAVGKYRMVNSLMDLDMYKSQFDNG